MTHTAEGAHCDGVVSCKFHHLQLGADLRPFCFDGAEDPFTCSAGYGAPHLLTMALEEKRARRVAAPSDQACSNACSWVCQIFGTQTHPPWWCPASFIIFSLEQIFDLSALMALRVLSLAVLAMARHTYSLWPLRKKGREE